MYSYDISVHKNIYKENNSCLLVSWACVVAVNNVLPAPDITGGRVSASGAVDPGSILGRITSKRKL